MLALLQAPRAAALSVIALALGCGTKVPEATCTACGSASYSSEECTSWGEAAGCERSSFFLHSASDRCRNGCSFKDCDRSPLCRESTRLVEPPDASADAAVDPRCANSDDGLFSSNPPCDDAGEFNLNGATYYYCPCSSGCPCGYTCGSIPLSVGGSIGAACAPR